MMFFLFLSSLSTFQQVVTSKGMYDESSPRAHDADRVRDAQRARHERGEPGRFVSVCFVTRNGHDQGVHSFGTNDTFKVVSPPMRRYSVSIGGSAPFPQYIPADHVRDVQRARHKRGDPCCSVSV